MVRRAPKVQGMADAKPPLRLGLGGLQLAPDRHPRDPQAASDLDVAVAGQMRRGLFGGWRRGPAAGARGRTLDRGYCLQHGAERPAAFSAGGDLRLDDVEAGAALLQPVE